MILLRKTHQAFWPLVQCYLYVSFQSFLIQYDHSSLHMAHMILLIHLELPFNLLPLIITIHLSHFYLLGYIFLYYHLNILHSRHTRHTWYLFHSLPRLLVLICYYYSVNHNFCSSLVHYYLHYFRSIVFLGIHLYLILFMFPLIFRR